jgi:HD-GYP domain-containing protein (c-di-GMP phosphodiesterase class II)
VTEEEMNARYHRRETSKILMQSHRKSLGVVSGINASRDLASFLDSKNDSDFASSDDSLETDEELQEDKDQKYKTQAGLELNLNKSSASIEEESRDDKQGIMATHERIFEKFVKQTPEEMVEGHKMYLALVIINFASYVG